MLIAALGLAVVSATPATMPAVLAAARPGDRIVMAPGMYEPVVILDRQFSPPLTLDAGKARFRLAIRRSSGVRVIGGELGPALGKDPENTMKLGPLGYAASVSHSSDVGFSGTIFADAVRGLTIGKSSDVTVDRATLTRLKTDGIDIALSRRVTVTNSTCTDFTPRPGDHPDCIQMWSRPEEPPTSDVVLRGNTARGAMQGFSGFNHVRKGVDDGGFDRITIENNTVYGTYPHGVALFAGRDSRITGNKTRALPGGRWRVGVNIRDCTRCVVENNDVGPKP